MECSIVLFQNVLRLVDRREPTGLRNSAAAGDIPGPDTGHTDVEAHSSAIICSLSSRTEITTTLLNAGRVQADTFCLVGHRLSKCVALWG